MPGSAPVTQAHVAAIEAALRLNISEYDRNIIRAESALRRFDKQTGGLLKKLEVDTSKAAKVMSASFIALDLALGTTKKALVATVSEATKWETAFTSVSKTVTASASEIAALEKNLKGLTREIPATNTELASIATTAGQLGIAAPDIASFTKTIAGLAEAADSISGEQAASQLAQISSITGLATSEMENLASSLVELGNNLPTTEDRVLSMGLQLAGAGKSAGLSAEQILGLSAAASSLGIQAERGGSAISAAFNKMTAAVASGGDELAAFAKISGVYAHEFAAVFREDATQAFEMFVAGLSKAQAEGKGVKDMLDTVGLGGMRSADVFQRFAGSADRVSEAVAMSSRAFRENTALSAEVEKRYATFESRTTLLSNAVTELAVELGGPLLGPLGAVADLASQTIHYFTDFVVAGKSLASSISSFLSPALGESIGLFESTKAVIDGILAPLRTLTALTEQAAAGLRALSAFRSGDLSGFVGEIGNFIQSGSKGGLLPGDIPGFATGGVIHAAKEGELFIGHGDEVVVPLKDGKRAALMRFLELVGGIPGFDDGGVTGNASASASGYTQPGKIGIDPTENMSDVGLLGEFNRALTLLAIKQGVGPKDSKSAQQFEFITGIPDLLRASFAGAIEALSGGADSLRKAFGEDEIERSTRLWNESFERSVAASEALDKEFEELMNSVTQTGQVFAEAGDRDMASLGRIETTFKSLFDQIRQTGFEKSPLNQAIPDGAGDRDLASLQQQMMVAMDPTKLVDQMIASSTRSTGQTVDIQSTFNLLQSLGQGSNGRGISSPSGMPSSPGGAIADALARAKRGEFLDIKQVDLGSLFGGRISDDLIRTVVDEQLSKANRQGAGQGSGMDFAVQNQRFIQGTLEELGRLALGTSGLREAQMDFQRQTSQGSSQMDILRERMALLSDSYSRRRDVEEEAVALNIDASGRTAAAAGRASIAFGSLSDAAMATGSALTQLMASGQSGVMASAGYGAGGVGSGSASGGGTVGYGAGMSIVVNQTVQGSLLSERELDDRVVGIMRASGYGGIGRY